MSAPLLDIRGLKVYYFARRGTVRAVDNVSLKLTKGESLGLVGESGCGKSTLGLAILRLVPEPGRIVAGSVIFDGLDLTKLPEEDMRRIRGSRIAMVFQDPMTSLNPLMKIGEQLTETLMVHGEADKEVAKEKAISILSDVGIGPERFNDYPHQLSGGMRQRVMIAMALILKPDLVIADEPTTALDVVTQAQIIDLMKDLKEKYKMSLIFISHDISLVSEVADRMAVMYAGQVVELGDVLSIFDEPLHPYTKALLEAIPNIELADQKLVYIPGSPPDLVSPPPGCRFHPRCPFATDKCKVEEPEMIEVRPGRWVKCFRYG